MMLQISAQEAMDVEKMSENYLEEKEILEEVDVEKIEEIVEEVQKGGGENKKRVEPWTKQITLRGAIASIVIGSIYSIILMKLNLTSGLDPNLNVSAALLAFLFVRTWTKMAGKIGLVSLPFTLQENTMIQTCAVACYSVALGGLS